MKSEWLRDTLKFCSTATAYTSIDDSRPPQLDPRLRRLFDKILWSRKFILTYHVVVLFALAVLSAVHWTGKWTRWRRKQTLSLRRLESTDAYDQDADPIRQTVASPASDNRDGKVASSSSSSTIVDSPRKDNDEETPLLDHGHDAPQHRPSLLSTARAFLMYQPRPLTIVNRSLPSNGTSLVVVLFLALNLFYTFYDIKPLSIEFVALADRYGLVFAANIPLLYLFAAKNQPLKFLTGRSYESLNIFHRRLGELMCLEAFLHSVGFFIVWYVVLKPSGFTLLHYILLKRNLIGIGMLLSYELLYFTSLGSLRHRWYELFLGIHVVFQLLALVGLYFHHATSKPYAVAALVIFLLDRIVYRLRLKSITVNAEVKILEDEETVRLSSIIDLQPGSRTFRSLGISVNTGRQATDHIFITIPSLSRNHILQAHPFTIASPAPIPGYEVARLELLVRAQDGFSRDLLNAARLHKSLTVRIDGPYGSSHARTMLEDSDLAIVIAGGSGIAVGWPLIKHLLAIRQSADLEASPVWTLRRPVIALLWVYRETAQLSWLGRQAVEEAELGEVDSSIMCTTGRFGRPNLSNMLDGLVDLYKVKGRRTRTRVVVSGPDGMGREVRNACARMVRTGADVDVAVEKFGW